MWRSWIPVLIQDTINMSIADLIQAAEYIERRDRGELDFLCLNCQSSALYAHVNMAPVYFCPAIISWFWRNGSVLCCRGGARIRVEFTGVRGVPDRRKASEDEEVAGQQVSAGEWIAASYKWSAVKWMWNQCRGRLQLYVFCSRTTHNELEKNRLVDFCFM